MELNMNKLSGPGYIGIWGKLLFFDHEGVYGIPKVDDQLKTIMFTTRLTPDVFRKFSHEKLHYFFKGEKGYYELYGQMSDIKQFDCVTTEYILFDVYLTGELTFFEEK